MDDKNAINYFRTLVFSFWYFLTSKKISIKVEAKKKREKHFNIACQATSDFLKSEALIFTQI